MLRDEIVYSHVGYYYLGIIQDCLLRFSWILKSYVTGIVTPVQSELLVTFFGTLEIFRYANVNFFLKVLRVSSINPERFLIFILKTPF